jgi:hypothetical protein
MHASARQTSPNQLRMWSRAELVDRLTPATPQPTIVAQPKPRRPRKTTMARPSTGRETSSRTGTQRDTTKPKQHVSRHAGSHSPGPGFIGRRTTTSSSHNPLT